MTSGSPIHTLTRRAVIGGLGAVVFSRHAALAAETPPAVIRFAGVNGGYAKPFGAGLIGVVQHFNYIENELRPDNVRIDWQFPEGTGHRGTSTRRQAARAFSRYAIRAWCASSRA